MISQAGAKAGEDIEEEDCRQWASVTCRINSNTMYEEDILHVERWKTKEAHDSGDWRPATRDSH